MHGSVVSGNGATNGSCCHELMWAHEGAMGAATSIFTNTARVPISLEADMTSARHIMNMNELFYI